MTRRISRPSENEGMTTLMTAVSECKVSQVKDLLGSGEDVYARDKHGRNVLYHAFTGSEMTEDILGIFQLLGKYGVNFNSNMDTDGCSALITAITLDWPILVQLLIEHGADIHEEGMPKFGASVSTDMALTGGDAGSSAHQQRDEDRFIFSKGCGQCVSPLLCAAMLKRHAIADILLSSGADCQQTSLGSFWRSSNIGACSVCDVLVSPVHIAAYNGNVDLLRQLLDRSRKRCLEANSDTSKTILSSTAEDITPLWLALLGGCSEAIKVLLEFDFPSAPPCHFGSGLSIALEEGHFDSARLLLLAGYDLWEDLEWIESELYPTPNMDFIDFIKDFVNQPRSLVVCCRNALRKHMGPRLSAYLSNVKVPQKVVDVIQLKDVLSFDEPASTDDVSLYI
ncbi:uncharacterized protein LOC143296352 [Babylonia areolata]|uniref:uncharacterized protein LOC143296352 n=1 Tax=Babylonia areolata TaxID=304850 RepID=UPI003FCEFF47